MKSLRALRDSRSTLQHDSMSGVSCVTSQLIIWCVVTITLTGCNSSTTGAGNTSEAQSKVDTYLSGAVGEANLASYVVDHNANTFEVTSYSASGGAVLESGDISTLGNEIEDLDITYLAGQLPGSPPLASNWLVEIAGEAGFVELEATNSSTNVTSTSFSPLAPTQTCPSIASAQTFLFVTVPERVNPKSTVSAGSWNPQLETAFGSVSIATNGNSVNFANISQFTLPPANGGGPGSPVSPAPSTAAAACSPTFYGETISFPTSPTISNPGSQGGQVSAPSATIAIGPSGFLVEDIGLAAPDLSPPYVNLLGAGYGAVGVPRPSSALTTSSVAAAQYQGILYGAASGSSGATSSPGFRLIGSFGYENLQTACPTLPGPSSSTVLYGGEFANNNPSANSFGNCDLAVDLGTQDANNNGVYPAAAVYVSASFPGNGLNSAYSFPAVAVAGQINGKYAIFLIGMDTVGIPAQPWGIYLLQSN
jgi:hypothetical protein